MSSEKDYEKANVTVGDVHGGDGSHPFADNNARIDALTPAEQKKVIRRIDIRLILTLGFMYCASLMDRTNLGIAAVAGMTFDLELNVGARYSIITLVFFFTYVALQPPATVVLRKVGPKLFLPGTCLAWGILTLGFGFVYEWHSMIPLRLVLGILEAGFFPYVEPRSDISPASD